jgi:hypothetical protein
MRALLMLLTLAGFVWLIRYSLKDQKPKDEASTTRRKKVESFVVEKENRSDSGDEKE